MRDMDKKRARDRARMRRMYGLAVEPSKLLVIDIETMANLVWEWDVKPRPFFLDPKMIVKQKRTISFAAKWVGKREVEFRSEFHDGREAMIRRAWELLDEADAVIGYNSKRFDTRHLNTEFAVEGLGRPSKYQHIDLLTTVRRDFVFGSNKLESVADRLGLGHKREHEGIALWLKTEAGDADAWRRMRLYNIQDVRLTEKLFKDLKGGGWLILNGPQSQKQLRNLLENQ